MHVFFCLIGYFRQHAMALAQRYDLRQGFQRADHLHCKFCNETKGGEGLLRAI